MQDDVGVGAGSQGAEQLDDDRPGARDADDDRGVGLLASEHPRCGDVPGAGGGGIRRGDGVSREGGFEGVARRRRLGEGPALEQPPEGSDVDRVVRRVVDVAGA